jgi:hypothetical protein
MCATSFETVSHGLGATPAQRDWPATKEIETASELVDRYSGCPQWLNVLRDACYFEAKKAPPRGVTEQRGGPDFILDLRL